MALDNDLEALRQKLDAHDDGNSAWTVDERRLLTKALADSQQARDGGAKTPQASRFQREFHFFAVCMGYCLLAYALLMLMQWWAHEPLNGPALFGLAYLGGLSVTALGAYYTGQWTPQRAPWTTLGLVIVALVLSFCGLVAGGGIGAIAGVVVGIVFFYALIRDRQTRRQPAATTAS